MIVRYLNHQDKHDPLNQKNIMQPQQLMELLNCRRKQSPFIAELSADNGFQITFGLSIESCVAQYSRANGDPPYLMAISHHPPLRTGYFEFLTANTPTPFAARYIIAFDELKEVLLYFLQTGQRSASVDWQQLNPRAILEDQGLPADDRWMPEK